MVEENEQRQTEKQVEFQIIKAEEVKFGKNNFIEIARKKAITEQGENEFISISRGYFMSNGEKRYKTSLTIPENDEIKEFVSKKIKNL